jgi:hypothetical protein
LHTLNERYRTEPDYTNPRLNYTTTMERKEKKRKGRAANEQSLV